MLKNMLVFIAFRVFLYPGRKVSTSYSGSVGARVIKDVRFQFFFFLCSKMHNGKTWPCLIGQWTIESTWRCFDWVMHNRSHVALFTLVKNQGPVAQSMVGPNRWLRVVKTYRFPWYLSLVRANHASSNPGQVVKDHGELCDALFGLLKIDIALA